MTINRNELFQIVQMDHKKVFCYQIVKYKFGALVRLPAA